MPYGTRYQVVTCVLMHLKCKVKAAAEFRDRPVGGKWKRNSYLDRGEGGGGVDCRYSSKKGFAALETMKVGDEVEKMLITIV